jgi:integrase
MLSVRKRKDFDMMTIENTNRKMGRKQKHYVTMKGETIVGLGKRPGDNRWTIIETGETKRWNTEHEALSWFKEWQVAQGKGVVRMATNFKPINSGFTADDKQISATSAEVMQQAIAGVAELNDTLEANVADANDTGDEQLLQNAVDEKKALAIKPPTIKMGSFIDIPESILGAWLRHATLNNSDYLAQITGIPQYRNLKDMPLPRASVSLKSLIEAYKMHAEVTETRKSKVETTWNKFAEITGATTLRELDVQKVLAFKDALVAEGHSPDTLASYFTRITGVIRFGLGRAMDAVEIQNALNKCEVLVPPKTNGEKGKTKNNAKPITKENFKKLLEAAAGDDEMVAMLWLMLNCGLYLKDVSGLKWIMFDFNKNTFFQFRNKTDKPQAACLWQETLDALSKIERKGEYVFQSAHGTAFSVGALRNKFRNIVKAAGNPLNPDSYGKMHVVEPNFLRDGAETKSVGGGAPFQFCQFLIGHGLPGQTGAYAQCNPQEVKPATDAVYKHYFG